MMISQKTPKSALLFKVIKVLNTLQHLSIVIRVGLGRYPQSLFVRFLSRMLTFFTPEPLFQDKGLAGFNTIFLHLVFWGLVLAILASVMMVRSELGSKSILKEDTKLKISLEEVYSKVFGSLLLLFRSFGFYSLIQIFGSHFSCCVKDWMNYPSNQCRGVRSGVLGLVTSILGIFLSISIAGLNQIFINDSYFDSTLPFSGFLSRLWKTEILLETVLAMISVSLDEVRNTKKSPQVLSTQFKVKFLQR